MRGALAVLAVLTVCSAQAWWDWDSSSPSYEDSSPDYEGASEQPAFSDSYPQNPTPSDPTDNYCACNPNQIYLDIIFIVDTSADMTSKTVGDATATIQSTLIPLSFGTDIYQSQVAILAFADKVQTVTNFGDLKTTNDVWGVSLPYLGGKATKMTDAIKQASSMISANEREFTRGVIVLLSKSFNQLDATNVKEAAEAFKDDGGIFITIDYAKGGIKGLEELATTGYYINDPSTNPDALNMDTIYALCDANCICPDGLYPYSTPNALTGREVPLGCYHVADVPSVYDAAAKNCETQKGFVATVHDSDKNFFMLQIFPMKSRYWLGMKQNAATGSYEWADGSNDGYTYWAPGNPLVGQPCVYGQQGTGLNSPWYSAPCTDPLKYSMTYACQLRPCDTEYDCRVPE